MTDEGKIVPVPMWVLKNLARSRGIRLPKLERIDTKAQTTAPIVIAPAGRVVEFPYRGNTRVPGVLAGFLPEGRHVPRVVLAEEIPEGTGRFELWRREQEKLKAARDQRMRGNLPRDDYRWWIGSEATVSEFALCRYCRQGHYGRDARNEHHSISVLEDGSMSCKHRLMLAYRRLNARGRCVICEKMTSLQTWGIPLCSEICQTIWMFQMKEPKLFTEAVTPRVPVKGARRIN